MLQSCKILVLALAFITGFTLISCSDDETAETEEIKGYRYIGSRSSHYGFKPFPEATDVAGLYNNMANKFHGGVPSAVWIVGGIDGKNCSLEFPKPRGTSYENISFWGSDKHEAYLTEFDKRGVKVFLQVEAGMANMETLIKLVLDQYGHHPSVAGFGVDIEWYPSEGSTNGDPDGLSVKLDTTELRKWDNLVKSYNPEYRVFVKHWIPDYCGIAPISDVIYINDTQGYPSKNHLVAQFKLWADHFYPNELGFQIGYPNDTTWWTLLDDPLLDIANTIDNTIKDQVSHLFWVDFTIHREEMSYLWP